MSDYIKKLYKLAGIEDYSIKNLRGFIPNGYKCITDENNKVLDIVIDFTAEKQLELIKKVLEKGLLQLNRSSLGNIQFCNFGNAGDYKAKFDEALASFVINLWKDLSDDQRKEIKNILDTTKN